MGRGKVVFKRGAGRKKNYWDDDEDDEYVAEEESSYESGSHEESLDASDAYNSSSSATTEEMPKAKVKARRGYASGRRRSKVSSYDQLVDDDFVDDEDLSPDATDEDDWEVDSLVLGDIGVPIRRGAAMGRRTKLKGSVSKPKVKKRLKKVASVPGKRKRRMVGSSDDEDTFMVKKRSTVKRRRNDSKKLSKKMSESISSSKNKSSIDAYSFDSDYLTSDDDLSLKLRVEMDRSRNKKKEKSIRRKKIPKEDSETSDSDFVVSNEEILDNGCIRIPRSRNSSMDERKSTMISKCTNSNDLNCGNELNNLDIERDLNMQKNEAVSAEMKGKEKKGDDLGKKLCGICLSEEHKRMVQGCLNCCSHFFCFTCIMEWSKVESRCPLCKRRFVTITKSLRSDSALQTRGHVIRIQMRDQVYQPSEEELRVLLDPYEDVVCMECHQGGDDSLMLLCDICDSSAHTYCVGLGREVPEGSWYCDCCKLAGEESLHSQVIGTRGASSNFMPHYDLEENGSNPRSSSIIQPISSQIQSSFLGSDLNVPSRNFMEGSAVSSSQAPVSWASTLSGRRAAQHRIRIILSNNRPRQLYAVPSRTDIALHTEAVGHSVLEQNGEQFHPSERSNSFYRILGSENSRDFPHSDSNLVRHMSNDGRNFRHVNGAKKQVHSMVKRYIKKLPMEIPLEEPSAFKKIVRKATHTILAACGIRHSRSAAAAGAVHEPPNSCSHDLDGGPVNLVTGCCSSCFCDYMKRVVKALVDTS